ncbi:DeoR/GlpR family DNA-binding transcription regulator [Methylobacterium sp. GC_Met_2]|uniref:DeoR/GlpR family DNA-binding transcription regulator n=1 Tax=Methylobacterium sp. GC_Met_2 TaxID=2937376 RepID=UPI00226B32E7|nr:DeoR/GlpR family DNA-binding transcription regulator [Methylobacterium sp. GC_Met_2]
MHERERHRIILALLRERGVATVQAIAAATGGSEATVRRDLTALADQGELKKLRGGAEALHAPAHPALSVVPLATPIGNTGPNILEKRAIARAAVDLCAEGDSIIINGGTTTFQMVHALGGLKLQVLTNSFSVADHLLRHSACAVMVPSGTIYREQNIILSPFEDDGTVHFRARRMFMGAMGLSALGLMERDALIISSEQRLMRQADELILLVDATKFRTQSSMILAPLNRATRIITDDRITDAERRMVEAAGVDLIVVDPRQPARRKETSATA